MYWTLTLKSQNLIFCVLMDTSLIAMVPTVGLAVLYILFVKEDEHRINLRENQENNRIPDPGIIP